MAAIRKRDLEESLRELLRELEEAWKCPICLMRGAADVVLCINGHAVCHRCFTLSHQRHCALCRQKMLDPLPTVSLQAESHHPLRDRPLLWLQKFEENLKLLLQERKKVSHSPIRLEWRAADEENWVKLLAVLNQLCCCMICKKRLEADISVCFNGHATCRKCSDLNRQCHCAVSACDVELLARPPMVLTNVLVVLSHAVAVLTLPSNRKGELWNVLLAMGDLAPLLTTVLSVLRRRCRHQPCPRLPRDREAHQQWCTYRPTNCRLCEWSGPVHHLYDHVHLVHPSKIACINTLFDAPLEETKNTIMLHCDKLIWIETNFVCGHWIINFVFVPKIEHSKITIKFIVVGKSKPNLERETALERDYKKKTFKGKLIFKVAQLRPYMYCRRCCHNFSFGLEVRVYY